MELSLEELEMLVYDARMEPKASLTKLLEEHTRRQNEEPIVWKLEEVIREVDNSEWPVGGLTFEEACNAFLIYNYLDDGNVEILKNRSGIEGIITKKQLNQEIKNIKIELNIK